MNSIAKHTCMAIVCAGTVLSISGCQSRPTIDEIDDLHDIAVRDAKLFLAEASRGCREAFPQGSPERTECLQDVMRIYLDLRDHIERTRIEAYNENWRSARRSREQIEERLRGLIPNWPDVQDILDRIPMNLEFHAIGVPAGGTFVYEGQPVGGGTLPINPTPIQATTYHFTGDASFLRDGELVESSITASLDIQISLDGLEATGKVHAGSLTADFGGGFEAAFMVLNEAGNTLSTDAAGTGWMTFRASFSHTEEAWEAILPSTPRLRFPITIDSAGVITIDSGFAAWEDYYIPRMRPYTDYNLDGVLDLTTDYAAFIADFGAMAQGADINADGEWDQDDINLWIQHFYEDFDVHGGN